MFCRERTEYSIGDSHHAGDGLKVGEIEKYVQTRGARGGGVTGGGGLD